MADLSVLLRSRIGLALGALILCFFTIRVFHESTTLRPYLSKAVGLKPSPFPQTTQDAISLTYDPRPFGIIANSSSLPVVAKVSMLYGDNEYYTRAIETHIRHAKRHGYPAYVLRQELITGVWNKLLYLIDVMVQELRRGDQGVKWIM
jgi:hypothetical protein